MMVVRQNILSTIMLKNVKLSMKMSDFTSQHQKYGRPEIYVVTLVQVLNEIKFGENREVKIQVQSRVNTIKKIWYTTVKLK